MAKVHISLVGGQPTPVYQGVILTKPDKVILICSAETAAVAKTIQAKLAELKYYNVLIEHLSVEYTSVIRERVNFIFENYVFPDDELSMNLISGAKIWSLTFLELCSQKDAHIFCISQNGKVLNIRGTSEMETVDFDMFTQFALLSNPLAKYHRYADYSTIDEQNAKTIKKLYANSVFQKMLKRVKEDVQQRYAGNNYAFAKTDQSIEIGENQYLEWHADEKVFSISLNDTEYYEVSGQFAVDMLLNTAWFEFEIAKMMAELYSAENVYTNCRFSSSNGEDKNEVDVIVNTGQKLLFIECKTQVTRITDIDKFASVVKTYGGTGSKALFVTLAPMKNTCLEKCKDNRISAINIETPITRNGKTHIERISQVKLKSELQTILSSTNF